MDLPLKSSFRGAHASNARVRDASETRVEKAEYNGGTLDILLDCMTTTVHPHFFPLRYKRNLRIPIRECGRSELQYVIYSET